jgi:drug/metabolite transporter (DMT)-like permease
MTPLLALLVSLLVEGFRPDLLTLCGLVLAAIGNVLMLRPALSAARRLKGGASAAG